MANRDIIVIGASAGGIDALCKLLEKLPKALGATVFIVVHVGEASALASILNRCGTLPVREAQDGEAFEKGHVYVAPSDRHLLVEDHVIQLSRGPRENRHRPAVDPLFRSAARAHRERVIGVILTGALDDGSAGLFAVKSRGGIAVVQDPMDAREPGMPQNALRSVDVDHCVSLDKIAPLLVKLTKAKTTKNRKASKDPKKRGLMTEQKKPGFRDDAVSFVCPECQGPLYECREGRVMKFACQVGHSFSAESLTVAHSDALDRALWIAVRTLNERIAIHEALAERSKEIPKTAMRQTEAAASAAHDVKLIREIIERL